MSEKKTKPKVKKFTLKDLIEAMIKHAIETGKIKSIKITNKNK